ncbi:MAG: hypothetical protein MJK14_24280 [Rivularia sp. ALOHA_DT_140]|nr:hypothetical protein [Rivularia sp. ALOHA_DT_140]
MKIWAATLFLVFLGMISPVKADDVKIAYDNSDKSRRLQRLISSKKINVKKAEFGILKTDKNGKVKLIPTTKIPLQEGTVYGWRIQLQEYQGKLTWQEVLTLPKPPLTWGTDNGEHFFLSPDGTKSVIKRTDLVNKGMVNNFWTVSSGDPTGKHVIEVYTNKHRIATFKFEVIRSYK